jgi:putative transposase
MKINNSADTQILSIMKEYMSGISVKDICRKYSISDTTFYNWKNRHFGASESATQKQIIRESKASRIRRLNEFITREKLALRDFIDSAMTEDSSNFIRDLSVNRTGRSFLHTINLQQ